MNLTLKKLTQHEQNTPDKPQHEPEQDYLAGLNDAQREAVTTANGPVLIVAGAGSGKTRVLTYRIAHLVQHGAKPWEILALTFTNKAAAEMKERIAKICSEDAARRIWAGTFHSVFARILRMEAEALGYTDTFTIYDTDDQLSVVRNAMSSLGISTQTISAQSIRSAISAAKNQMIGWQDYATNAGDFRERQIAKVYETYERNLRRNNAMDFDDLLLNMIRLLESSEAMLKKYQARFSHILVDEYQDTNRAQYIAVQLLAGAHRNLCVVGDDAQSIYRWRGADIRNILDFQKDYPEAVVVRLEQNYRSTKSILAAADGVIKNNRRQIPKTLWTENHDGEQVVVIQNRDDRDEAERVVTIIQQEVQTHNISPRDVAVLYRTNAQSQPLEDALRRANVPYTIISGVSFYKRKEVKDTAAYLRLLINPNDGESLLRIVNEPSRGIGDTSLGRIQAWAEVQGIGLLEAFRRSGDIPSLMKRAQNAAYDFASLIDRYAVKLRDMPPDELAQQYIESTGLLQMYREQHTDEAEDRYNNIVRLLTDISEYTITEEEPSLQDYLQRLALMSDVDESDTTKNRVALMTLHAAKGLEFPVVIIAGAEEGLLPLVKDNAHADEREEERRLMYVGITRARERLYITYAERRMRFGSVEYSMPSSFLHELPEEIVEWAARKRRSEQFERTRFDAPPTYSTTPPRNVTKPMAPPPPTPRSIPMRMPVTKPAPPPPKSPSMRPAFDDIPTSENYSQVEGAESFASLKRGMKVRHKLFGNGTVETVSGTGANQKAVINFPGAGRKHLMVKFAKLEVV